MWAKEGHRDKKALAQCNWRRGCKTYVFLGLAALWFAHDEESKRNFLLKRKLQKKETMNFSVQHTGEKNS